MHSNTNPVAAEATQSSGIRITIVADEFDGNGNAVARITVEDAERIIRDLRSAILQVEFNNSLSTVTNKTETQKCTLEQVAWWRLEDWCDRPATTSYVNRWLDEYPVCEDCKDWLYERENI